MTTPQCTRQCDPVKDESNFYKGETNIPVLLK